MAVSPGETIPLPRGMAMSVTAEVRGRSLRLLVVNGESSPLQSRLPFLQAIAEACKEASALGRPYDFVVGDFNTPSRSIGFDELAAQGYRLAGRSSSGWRATFPAWLPVYDIDHVWLGRGSGHRFLHVLQWSLDGPSWPGRSCPGGGPSSPDREPTASYP